MKKYTVNLLCILIVGVLAASVLTPIYMFGKLFVAGFEAGYNSVDQDVSQSADVAGYNPEDFTMIDVAFQPDINNIMHPSDSIAFSDGHAYPVVLSRASMWVPANETGSSMKWATMILYAACLILFVIFIVQLVKFVININRGNIFVKENATRLYRLAWIMISISLLRIIAGSIDDFIFNNLNLQLNGYSLSTFWTIPWSSLLCGLLAMLIARVWSQGIELKEEQSLTI